MLIVIFNYKYREDPFENLSIKFIMEHCKKVVVEHLLRRVTVYMPDEELMRYLRSKGINYNVVI